MAEEEEEEKELGAMLVELGNELLTPPSAYDELLNLLDRLEYNLSKVEQSPSRSLQDALLPSMKALKADGLLRHLETDVKVSVTSCISEITRITAPNSPYDDKQMKEIFQLIVAVFGKLSDESRRSHAKAVSILHTVALVRSCLVMLDLELDALIINMFQIFFQTIRSDHPPEVFMDMEIIMTLVVEESEEISSELLCTLLDSVKKENQNVSQISWKLGENVIKNCAAKLNPYLMKAVQSMGIALSDYSQIVASICHNASDTLEQNHVDSPGEHLAEENKTSERTDPDELSQVARGLALDTTCCGEVGLIDHGAQSMLSNDTAQTKNGDTLVDGNPLKTLKSCRRTKKSKSADARSSSEPDNPDSMKGIKSETEPETVPQKRGRRPNSLLNPDEGYDIFWYSRQKKDPKVPFRVKNKGKVIDSSPSENPVCEEAALPSAHEAEIEPQGFSPKMADSELKAASFPSSNHRPPEGSHLKKDRRKRLGSMMNQDTDQNSLSVPKGDLFKEKIKEDKDIKPADVSLKKESEHTSGLETKPLRQSKKKVITAKTNGRKEALPSAHAKEIVPQAFSPKKADRKTKAASFPSSICRRPEGSLPKRGGGKNQGIRMNQDADQNSLSVPKGDLFSDHFEHKDLKPADVSLKKESKHTSGLETKSLRRLSKKATSAKSNGKTTPAPGDVVLNKGAPSDLEEKPLALSIMNPGGRDINEKGSSVQQNVNKKRSRGKATVEKDVTEESGDKMMAAGSARKSSNENKTQLDEGGQRKKLKSMITEDAYLKFQSVPKGDLFSYRIKDKDLKPADTSLKNKSKHTSGLETKPLRRLIKKATAAKTIGKTTPAPGDVVLNKRGPGDLEEKPLALSLMSTGARDINEKGSLVQQIVGKKRGRGKDTAEKDASEESVPKGDLFNDWIEDEDLKPADVSLKKESKHTSGVETKPLRQLKKKATTTKTNGKENPGSGGVVLKKEGPSVLDKKSLALSSMSTGSRDFNEKGSLIQQIVDKKRSKGEAADAKNVTEESGDKMVAGLTSKSSNQNENHLDKSPKKKSRRMRTPRKEEASSTPHSVEDLDEPLIGSRIKVWWPMDKTFYEGVVDSFDHAKKKHKVIYADGDVEMLNLRKQRWELIGNDLLPDEGKQDDHLKEKQADLLNYGVASDMPQKRIKIKIKPLPSSKKEASSSSKRSGVSTSKPVDSSTLGNPVIIGNPKDGSFEMDGKFEDEGQNSTRKLAVEALKPESEIKRNIPVESFPECMLKLADSLLNSAKTIQKGHRRGRSI